MQTSFRYRLPVSNQMTSCIIAIPALDSRTDFDADQLHLPDYFNNPILSRTKLPQVCPSHLSHVTFRCLCRIPTIAHGRGVVV